MFGIFSIVYILVMLANAACILNEERFLCNIGIGKNSSHATLRQLAEIIRVVKTICTIPLILLNTLFIVYEILFG